MTKPEFKASISLGNWLTIGSLVVAMAVGWGVVTTQQEANAIAVAELKAKIQDVDLRLRELETEDARVQERYNSLISLLNRIDRRLARIEAGTD